VPTVIVEGSIVIAMALIGADTTGSGQWQANWPRLFGASAAGARGVLSTIAGSMVTVVGVTFLMVLVTLALASSQYTSRILRNFMRDRVTQIVLGTFAGIFTYCLIVLRPSATATRTDLFRAWPWRSASRWRSAALARSFSSFITSHPRFRPRALLRRWQRKPCWPMTLFPEKLGQGPPDSDEELSPPALPEQNWQAVPARRNGYIQSVDNAAILRLAREHQTIVRMERGIGDFAVRDTPLASLALKDPPTAEMIAALQSAYSIDRHRTLERDSAFGIRQIVDMALRALSPSTNDTTTAVMCVDYLTAILSQLATKDIPSSHRYEKGELRVIAVGPTFERLVVQSFDQIRGSAVGNTGVMLRMLGGLQTIGSLTADRGRRRVLREQVAWIAELAERTIASPHDRARVKSRLARVREALETKPVLSKLETPDKVLDKSDK
jgi:uncharacterized membrane protein